MVANTKTYGFWWRRGMGYGVQIPVHWLGGPKKLWDISGRLPDQAAYTKVSGRDRVKLSSLHRSGNHKLLQVENRISNCYERTFSKFYSFFILSYQINLQLVIIWSYQCLVLLTLLLSVVYTWWTHGTRLWAMRLRLCSMATTCSGAMMSCTAVLTDLWHHAQQGWLMLNTWLPHVYSMFCSI